MDSQGDSPSVALVWLLWGSLALFVVYYFIKRCAKEQVYRENESERRTPLLTAQ